PVYAGDLGIAPVPSLRKRVREADIVIAVGTRLGDITTADYTTLEVPRPAARLVHVYPDADEIGRVFQAELGIVSGPNAFAAAVAASLMHPERLVVCFVGDGGFLMSGQEIATAVQHGARPILVVFNNASYGTIRMHQERDYPGRTIATELVNPDFAALARAYG